VTDRESRTWRAEANNNRIGRGKDETQVYVGTITIERQERRSENPNKPSNQHGEKNSIQEKNRGREGISELLGAVLTTRKKAITTAKILRS